MTRLSSHEIYALVATNLAILGSKTQITRRRNIFDAKILSLTDDF